MLALLLAWALVQSEMHYAREVLSAASEQWVQAGSCEQDAQAPAVGSLVTVSSWGLTALAVQTLRLLVQGSWTFARLRRCLPHLHRYLCSRRRQRRHQESTIRRQLLSHLGQVGFDSSLVFCCSSA